jgi:hypothetical protein
MKETEEWKLRLKKFPEKSSQSLKFYSCLEANVDYSAEVTGLHKVNWYNCRLIFFFFTVCILKKSFPNLMHVFYVILTESVCNQMVDALS